MRPFPINNPIITRQHRQKKRKWGRILIVVLLIGINGYLFLSSDPFFTRQEDRQINQPELSQPESMPDPIASPYYANLANLKEIDGIAGIRSSDGNDLNLAFASSRLRFDLTKAENISGVRTLSQWCECVVGVIEKSDTFSDALLRNGVEPLLISSLTNALQNDLDFRNIQAGERFELWLSPSGNIERFMYNQTPLVSYLVERRSDKLVGHRISKETQKKLVPLSVRIDDSLYVALSRIGESPALVMMLVDIFAWDIDFYIDTHAGDTIRLLVEKEELEDEFVQYGRIFAVEYRGDIGTHLAFYYQTQDGTTGYYDVQGNSLRKTFLKSPLKFTYISSGYGTRVHPVLGFSKMHAGIDLAAPVGTPIWAPADGVVTFSGYQGNSGKLVTLRHANGYETVFAHLHTISKNLSKGSRVKQMQIIGTVGSTGLSTGPHLHYGMKKNGQNVSPFSQRFPPIEPVPRQELTKYKSDIAPLLDRIENIPFSTGNCTASVQSAKEESG